MCMCVYRHHIRWIVPFILSSGGCGGGGFHRLIGCTAPEHALDGSTKSVKMTDNRRGRKGPINPVPIITATDIL